ncbi:MAG: cell division protein ZapD [Gammaproteobacteria bacterium]|nr:cell division protein ZapD [Gammaproteobacteria bacterium]
MSGKYQTFEQPLSERIRMCLRVETLMNRFHYFEALKGDWSAYSALLTILELTALLERGDLKQELMKELERQHGALRALTQHQGIDHSKLELILSKQKNALDRLHRLDGKLGEHLKRDDFLLAIKQRTSIPGGSCDFDLPQLRFWMNQHHEKRISDLREWAAPYCHLEDVIELILKAIRDSASARPVVAENGFYQKPLDTKQSTQLIRIGVDAQANIYPEISAGKHRYSVRFMRLDSGEMAPAQVKEDVEFMLSRCAL